MYLLALILGSLEVALVVWLFIFILEGYLWAWVGLIAYYAWTLYIGGNFTKLLLSTISGVGLALIFLNYGFWYALGAFIILLIIFEFIPRGNDEQDDLVQMHAALDVTQLRLPSPNPLFRAICTAEMKYINAIFTEGLHPACRVSRQTRLSLLYSCDFSAQTQ